MTRWTGQDPNRVWKRVPYATDSLDFMRRVGHKRLIARCRAADCDRWRAMPVDDMIVRFGPAATIAALEPRFRCTACGALGASIEPEPRD